MLCRIEAGKEHIWRTETTDFFLSSFVLFISDACYVASMSITDESHFVTDGLAVLVAMPEGLAR